MKSLKIRKVQLFILLIFLLPQANDYRVYFSSILIYAILFFFNLKIVKSNFIARVFLFGFMFVSFFTMFRFFTIVPANYKDFTELGRLLLPTYMVLMLPFFKDFKIKDLLMPLSIIVSIDFFVSLLEFFYLQTSSSSIYQFVKTNYWATQHWHSSYRSKGLTPGPGQHAIFGVFMFVLFLSNYLFNKNQMTKKNIVFILMTMFIIASSLSRTGVVCMIISFIFLIYFYSKKVTSIKQGFSLVAILFLFIGIGGYYAKKNSANLERVSLVFTEGTSNRSFTARVDNWGELVDVALTKEPGYLLIGWGKEFFGEIAHQTDNEFVFILLFYGLIFLMFFVLFTLRYLIKTLFLNKKRDFISLTICTLIVVGYIFAIPSSFFFYVQNLVLFTLLLIIDYHNKTDKLKDIQSQSLL
ncbi:hypothetical protein [uncultured Dokdonia sp.]|uniref:O-antigen ligase family protein n=1 Tax=uncultured Dokdonia sp. TaxID=575653 RepID=UPI0026180922|nr:hypothetical protein [uncultured Dokdonia sp.]